MALPATGTILGAGGATQNIIIPGTPSGRSSLPTTFAVLPSSTMGGASIQLQAGFVNAAGVTEWMAVGAAFTAAGAVNVAMRANYFRLNATGVTGPTAVNWWFG